MPLSGSSAFAVFIDASILGGLVLVSSAIADRLDALVALFGLIAFALVASSPGSSRRLNFSALDDAGRLLRGICFAYAITSAIGIFLGKTHLQPLLLAAAASFPLLAIGRSASYRLDSRIREREPKTPAVVVGSGDIARRVVGTLAAHPEYRLEVVGVIDDGLEKDNELQPHLLGDLRDVEHLVGFLGAKVVIVASNLDQDELRSVVRSAVRRGAAPWWIPPNLDFGLVPGTTDDLWGIPVIRLPSPARDRPEWVLKRVIDVVVAAVGLIAAAPIMTIIAVSIAADSGRPILYRQRRVGLDGRAFDMLKFRSMRNGDRAQQDTAWRTDESRLTRVGRIARNTNLDELPQLLNVLKGDMSLVGPRPERPYFVDLFKDVYPEYVSRHRVPAGITGWAQIHGLRGDTSIEERVMFDNHYIANWSPALDLKILLRTLAQAFLGRNGKH